MRLTIGLLLSLINYSNYISISIAYYFKVHEIQLRNIKCHPVFAWIIWRVFVCFGFNCDTISAFEHVC